MSLPRAIDQRGGLVMGSVLASSAEELAELRLAVASFIDDERSAGNITARCDAWMRGFDRGFSRRLGERGWLGINWPTEYQGGGRSHLARLIVTEELLRAGAPVAAHWIGERQIGPAILRYGSDRLRAEMLPPIAAGQLTFCLGMSEHEAGSDLAAVRTVAIGDGDDFRITGSKIWTTGAHEADFAYVLACTDRNAPKAARLTEFIVNMRAPGVEVRPIIDLSGEHHFNEVIFDEVPVPGSAVLGQVGRGWEQVTAQLSFERGGAERFLSTYPLLEALADMFADGDTTVVERLGGLIARLHGLRTLAWRIAQVMDNGVAPIAEAAILKILGTEFEQDVVELGRWLLEPEPPGDAREVTALMADAQLALPGISLRGGATEILGGIVARAQGRKR
jgi:acyl-CoA dehydrogenase